jgi:hypothetical protein
MLHVNQEYVHPTLKKTNHEHACKYLGWPIEMTIEFFFQERYIVLHSCFVVMLLAHCWLCKVPSHIQLNVTATSYNGLAVGLAKKMFVLNKNLINICMSERYIMMHICVAL